MMLEKVVSSQLRWNKLWHAVNRQAKVMGDYTCSAMEQNGINLLRKRNCSF